RVTAKDIILQNTREGPMHASVSGISIATLPEVRQHTVELSPTNCHPAGVGRVNGDRTFVSGIADDVIPVCIDVHLIANEYAMRRDHSRRRVEAINVRGRHIVFCQWLFRLGFHACASVVVATTIKPSQAKGCSCLAAWSHTCHAATGGDGRAPWLRLSLLRGEFEWLM